MLPTRFVVWSTFPGQQDRGEEGHPCTTHLLRTRVRGVVWLDLLIPDGLFLPGCATLDRPTALHIVVLQAPVRIIAVRAARLAEGAVPARDARHLGFGLDRLARVPADQLVEVRRVIVDVVVVAAGGHDLVLLVLELGAELRLVVEFVLEVVGPKRPVERRRILIIVPIFFVRTSFDVQLGEGFGIRLVLLIVAGRIARGQHIAIVSRVVERERSEGGLSGRRALLRVLFGRGRGRPPFARVRGGLGRIASSGTSDSLRLGRRAGRTTGACTSHRCVAAVGLELAALVLLRAQWGLSLISPSPCCRALRRVKLNAPQLTRGTRLHRLTRHQRPADGGGSVESATAKEKS